MSEDQPLVKTLADLADALVSQLDVAELFYRLVDSCLTLTDTDEAALLLMDREGELGIAAATSESTHLVELLQLQAREGPCLDAFRTGQPVRSGPLESREARDRWPDFAPRASAAGFDSVVAVPMRLRDTVLGSLNLFRIGSGEASERDILAAQTLAHLATVAIVQDRVVGNAMEVIDQLQSALDTRVSIEQAKGIIAEQARLDVSSAFTRIREYARSKNLRLEEVSASIIAGDLRADQFNEDGTAIGDETLP